MHPVFGRSLLISGIAHAVVLFAFIIFPSLLRPRRLIPRTIELVNPADLLPPPVTSIAPEKPEPERVEALISRTTRRTTRQTTRQTTSTKETSSTSSQQTTRRTTSRRATTRATSRRTTSRPVIDTGELRNRLDRAIGADRNGASRMGTPGVADGTPSWYYDVIRRTLYDAWRPPPHAPQGLSCTVEMRVDRSGTIGNIRLLRSSGDAGVDESALAAVRAAGRVPPLPPQIAGSYKDLSIAFVVEGGN